MKLLFNCGTVQNFDRFQNCIAISDFYGEFDDTSLYASFEVESQLDADVLELELQKIINENDINGYFEVED